MLIKFVDSNSINKEICFSKEKEFDKFINAIKISGTVEILNELYSVDYITIVVAEIESKFNSIKISVHKVE